MKLVTTLLPPNPLEVGEVYSKDELFVNYTNHQSTATFDEILERSFLESLLISFYFAENALLSNEIMNLTKRVCKQKRELLKNI